MRFPKAETLGRISGRVWKQTERQRLQRDLRYYEPKLVELRKTVLTHAKEGYSIVPHNYKFPQTIVKYLTNRGFDVSDTQISWLRHKPM